MKHLFLIIPGLLLLLNLSANGNTTQPKIKYAIHLHVDNLAKGSIKADVDVEVTNHTGIDTLEFLFPVNFKVNTLKKDNNTEVIVENSELPYLGEVTILKALAKNGTENSIGFTIKYTGVLDSLTLNESLINLSNESFWYPFFNPFKEIVPITEYKVTVKAPVNFHLTVPEGKMQKNKSSYTISVPPGPHLLQIYGSRNLSTLTVKEEGVTIKYDKLLNELSSEDTLLAKSVLDILTYFHSSFAATEPLPSFHFVRHPYKGNSYAFQNGFIFREEGYKETPSFHRYLAHEVSHSWWQKASNVNYNRWLNESFAEYSGHLYVLAKFGEETFNDLITERMKASYDADPIYQTDKFYNYAIMYDKGTYRLYQLHKKLGDELFFHLLEKMIIENVTTTEGMLEVIERLKDKETRKWFLSKLKQ